MWWNGDRGSINSPLWKAGHAHDKTGGAADETGRGAGEPRFEL